MAHVIVRTRKGDVACTHDEALATRVARLVADALGTEPTTVVVTLDEVDAGPRAGRRPDGRVRHRTTIRRDDFDEPSRDGSAHGPSTLDLLRALGPTSTNTLQRYLHWGRTRP